MEIKDVMLQALRAITVLQISYETVLDRRNEYDKEHPEERGEDGWILHKNPPFGLNGIETIIEENYNMIIEWLIEGLEERDLSDLVKVKSFFAFWQKYQRCYKYQYSDKEEFIDEVPGRILEKLEFKIKYDDDIQTRVKLYDEKYRIPMTDEEIKESAEKAAKVGSDFFNPEPVEEDKMDKYYEKDVSYEEKHGLEENNDN